MTVAAMAWAWSQPTRSSGQRLVLLAYADATSDHDDPGKITNGLTAWPKIDTIAAMCGLSNSTVRTHVDSLVEDGLVEKMGRRVHGTRAGATVIRLLTDERSKSADPSAVRSADPQAVKSADPSAVIPIPEPKEMNPKDEPTQALALVDAEIVVAEVVTDFDDWYRRWPRKQGKAEARLRWAKMTADERAAAFDALPGWERLAEVEGNAFLPYASTWLNQSRWEDEPPVVNVIEHKPRSTARGMGALRTRAERIVAEEAAR